jgi:hypothetical protein
LSELPLVRVPPPALSDCIAQPSVFCDLSGQARLSPTQQVQAAVARGELPPESADVLKQVAPGPLAGSGKQTAQAAVLGVGGHPVWAVRAGAAALPTTGLGTLRSADIAGALGAAGERGGPALLAALQRSSPATVGRGARGTLLQALIRAAAPTAGSADTRGGTSP